MIVLLHYRVFGYNILVIEYYVLSPTTTFNVATSADPSVSAVKWRVIHLGMMYQFDASSLHGL
jgi:hypothetical protein